MEYLSVTQTAEKWGIKQRRIRVLCDKGRIPGAFKILVDTGRCGKVERWKN